MVWENMQVQNNIFDPKIAASKYHLSVPLLDFKVRADPSKS